MLIPGIYPHRLCFAGALKAKSLIEIDGPSVGGKHLLMEATIYVLHCLHHFSTDTFALVAWVHE